MAKSHKNSLTFDDAIQVWCLLWQGMYQHHIASIFGVNQGRISEVKTGKRHPGSRLKALLTCPDCAPER